MKKKINFFESQITMKIFRNKINKLSTCDAATIRLFMEDFIIKFKYNRYFFKENEEEWNSVLTEDICDDLELTANKMYDDKKYEEAKPFYEASLNFDEFYPEISVTLFKIYLKYKKIDPDWVLSCLTIEGWQPEDQGGTPEDMGYSYYIEEEFPGIWDNLPGKTDEEIYMAMKKAISDKLNKSIG